MISRPFSTILLPLALIVIVVVTISFSPSAVEKRHIVELYREQFFVKLGTTTDSKLMLSLFDEQNLPVQQKRFVNHSRTLRAYVSHTSPALPRVVIESSKPNTFYILNGSYAVTLETASLKWMDNTTLSFHAADERGMPVEYVLDVHTGVVVKNALHQMSLSGSELLEDQD